MTSYRGILVLATLLIVGPLLLMLAGDHSSSSNAEMHDNTSVSSSCPAMPDCAASPSCSQHCSSLIRDDFAAPTAPAVTSARPQIGPAIVQAIAADVHKPPPRFA